jgi:hypothetical protein
MSLMAFSVRRSSVVSPRYSCAAVKVTRDKRVRMTGQSVQFPICLHNRMRSPPWTMCAVALGNFFVRRKASAGMTARVLSSTARATVPCSVSVGDESESLESAERDVREVSADKLVAREMGPLSNALGRAVDRECVGLTFWIVDTESRRLELLRGPGSRLN